MISDRKISHDAFKMLLSAGKVFAKASPHEVSSYVNSHIGNHSIELSRNTSRAMLNYRKFGPIGLGQLSYGERATVSTVHGLKHAYHLQLVLCGSCEVRQSPNSLASILTPGMGFVINPTDPAHLSYSDDCIKLIIRLPVGLINSRLSDRLGYLPSNGLRFSPDAFQREEGSTFSKLLELLLLEANDEEPATSLPVSSSISVLLANKMLEVFPHDLPALHSPSTDFDFFAPIDSYIDERARLGTITVEDLARLSNVSLRTLYHRFKKIKGVTPQAYIKARRLQNIQHHIHASGGRSVTEVAMEYGFTHLGRFSSEYKSLFGELPSETLRRVLRPKDGLNNSFARHLAA